MKNIIFSSTIFLLFSSAFILVLFSCGKPKNVGVDKKYTLKVVFSDNSETEINTISSCPPVLSTRSCNSGTYLYINCDHGDKIAVDVKYFSIIN